MIAEVTMGPRTWPITFFLLDFLFLMRYVSKVFVEFLPYCFCFMFWFFGHEACVILASWPGIELTPPALEGAVLTTDRQGSASLYTCKVIT